MCVFFTVVYVYLYVDRPRTSPIESSVTRWFLANELLNKLQVAKIIDSHFDAKDGFGRFFCVKWFQIG